MEQKGQIFFFGRPGCLKQSIPIRVNNEDEKSEEDTKDKNESEKPTQTSDDDTDGDELMKRISEVLDDEPGNSQNHNDKTEENCEKLSSPVNNNNDHDKLVKEENNDNMLSALDELSENSFVEKEEKISEKCDIDESPAEIIKCDQEISPKDQENITEPNEKLPEAIVSAESDLNQGESISLNQSELPTLKSTDEVAQEISESVNDQKESQSIEDLTSDDKNYEEPQKSPEPIEIPPVTEDICIPDSCDKESNRIEKVIEPESSSLMEEIDPKSEPIETSENTQNDINEMTEQPSIITEVLDSNKNQAEELPSESVNVEEIEPQETLEESKPLVEEKSSIDIEHLENCEVVDSNINEQTLEEPEKIVTETEIHSIDADSESLEKESIKSSENENLDNLHQENFSTVSDMQDQFSSAEIVEKVKEEELISESVIDSETQEEDIINEEVQEESEIINEVQKEENIVANEVQEENIPDNVQDEEPSVSDANKDMQEPLINESPVESPSEKVPESLEFNNVKVTQKVEPEIDTEIPHESKTQLNNEDEKINEVQDLIDSSQPLENKNECSSIEMDQENISEMQEKIIEATQDQINEDIVSSDDEPEIIDLQINNEHEKSPISNEHDAEIISNVEEHKGVEILESKSEDVSIAEEALPKEEIFTKNQQLEQVPSNSSNQSDSVLENKIESEILPQKIMEEELNAKSSNAMPKSPANDKFEDCKSSQKMIEDESVDSDKVESIEEKSEAILEAPQEQEIIEEKFEAILEVSKEQEIFEKPVESILETPLAQETIEEKTEPSLEVSKAQEIIEVTTNSNSEVTKTQEIIEEKSEYISEVSKEQEIIKSPSKSISEEIKAQEIIVKPSKIILEASAEHKIVGEPSKSISEASKSHEIVKKPSEIILKASKEQEIIEKPSETIFEALKEETKSEGVSKEHEKIESINIAPKEQEKIESINKVVEEVLPTKAETTDSKEEIKEAKSQVVTRKRKISERKSISESDSDGGHFVSESVSQDPESDVEEAVQRKKPRIRGKVMTPRRKLPTRHSARVEEAQKVEPLKVEEKPEEISKDESESKTIQNFKFDYDENEDVVANIAAIKTLICKETPKEEAEASSDSESPKRKGRPGRKGKRGRPAAKKMETQENSSSDEENAKSPKLPDSKRTKTSENETPQEPVKKKREIKKGLLRDLDTSLVIETIDNEAPVRASRRIAQQKIKEETDRRLMEEKMLKKMKDEAEKKKKGSNVTEEMSEKSSDSDESFKGESVKKKKKKINPSDKHWQTSSSHSEHTDTDPEEYEQHHYEDPGSPLFRSDHEFSPESEDDDTTPAQPVKRARTAKKQVEESSDEEYVNPNHACQVCHKTDSPEWILLCDECDHGYHCSCLKPIIFCIPSGNWYCPLCCHKKLITDLGVQLEKFDVLVESIKVEEMRKQVEEVRRQKQLEAKKLAEITEENIINDRRNKRPGARKSNDKENPENNQSSDDSGSESNDNGNDNSSSDDSSDDAPLIYKLRKRTQATTSYRFNDYDELINSAIRDEMEEIKGLGNAGRGKDISTIIEADKEEKKQQQIDKEKTASGFGEKKMQSDNEQEGGDSSGSDIGRSKKSMQRKKKNRKLNNLEDTSEEENSDDDFKGSSSSNSDTEDFSASSGESESSLDLPKKKNKFAPRNMRTRNRRLDEKFIDDHSSDDEPLIKKRNKKNSDSEEEFDLGDGSASGSTADEVDSEDLCDDTDTESSESNWPRKKKRVASYDKKPRKPVKKHDEDDDKAFRAGISKKKILEKKKEEEESEGSGSEKGKGRRKTRGKKLLYIMEDDFESDDGIKPGAGVVRPETPPEEREMFIKKQEEIKKMLAAKNTEGARKLAVPTIEPISFDMEQPESPSPPPLAEGSSLSTIPKDVIQGAKALDFDYNRIKPVTSGSQSKTELQPEMSEEELAKMMEEEDFAQHQLKLAGEAIRKQQAILELEGKEEAFVAFSKTKLKDEKPLEVPVEPKKRAKKPKVDKALIESTKEVPKPLDPQSRPMPPHTIPSTQPLHPSAPHHPLNMTSAPPPLISNVPHQQPLHIPYSNLPPSRFPLNPNQPLPPHGLQERPSVLSSYMARAEMHPQQSMRFHQMPPESFMPKGPHLPPHMQLPPQTSQPAVPEEKDQKKGGRRKKYTPLRQDLPEANVSKVAKLDTPTAAPSVIHTNVPPSADDKSKVPHPRSSKPTVAVASPPQIFNPGTNPTPSVITRLIQQPNQSPQQRIGPYAGFNEHIGDDNAPTSQPPPSTTTGSRAYPSTDEIKHLAAAAAAASKQSRPSPQSPFNENPFVPRTMHHTLYRAPPTSQSIYGIPPHARLPYPFHLPPHPNNNLRPNMPDYASSPYAIPPQFAYYGAPPSAHSRQPNATHPISHPEGVHHPPPPGPPGPPRGDAENPQQQTPSEFGGLVSYFSSQQELD